MKTTLCHFLSTDNLRLPGLLYEPDKKTKSVALFLHGNGSSSIFYKPEMNLYGEIFTNKNIAFFPFNNRGAHLVKSLKRKTEIEDERCTYGTYYEQIAECVYDIDGAIEFLKTKSFTTFYLIGHSTGANKIVVYHYHKPENPVAKYLLLAGGDDTGLSYATLGNKRFHAALDRSRSEVQKGNGMNIVPKYLFPEPYSYQALYDTLNPDGDYNIFPFYEALNGVKLSSKPLFRHFEKINKPTLVVYGEQDEFCYGDVKGCIDALRKHSTYNLQATSYKLISNTGHGFDGKEEELGKLMVDWLKNT
ncbi:DUF1749 domain-containing protein [Candidatus Woesebacteria bacterium]|nr:DUF1749 domain-containing protein [Candidatus Woesebacteria bacterium]